MATSDLGVVKPVNKGAWDVGTAYEELNMVLDGGKIYMANKAVPAGTALTVVEYWINMSGDGLTEPALQAWSKSVVSDSNKIITEAEELALQALISTNATNIALNETNINTKISDTDYAATSTGGVIKLRVSGGDCFITTNGTDA